MAKPAKSRHKTKRKAKQKQVKSTKQQEYRLVKAEFFLFEAMTYSDNDNLTKALACIQKAHRLAPKNAEVLWEMGRIGSVVGDWDIELKSLLGLHAIGALEDEHRMPLLDQLARAGRYKQCLALVEETLALWPRLKIKDKRRKRAHINHMIDFCNAHLAPQPAPPRPAALSRPPKTPRGSKPAKPPKEIPPSRAAIEPAVAVPTQPSAPKTVPISFDLDRPAFEQALSQVPSARPVEYELALEGYGLRFQESFEHLVSLGHLTNVRSFWYQEETARKVLKQFRGRALLSDEVGLGKTIEALIVFSEYLQRGMIQTGLILTPTPLVSQWKQELLSKFGLDIPSTDDPVFKSGGEAFWEAPFVLASINLAKSKKNFDTVTAREYDLVIVDEAHHLKNRSTLNWKLVNTLKKRFILLLTATPVENNLMELYNLITLLKPGQLSTASAFRQEFMTRGDPTDPRNRTRLKGLLGQVMIRNTRSLAGIRIPPRFAETIRIPPSNTDQAVYDRVTTLAQELDRTGRRHKLLLKNLLAQAGSSPHTLGKALSRMIAKNDYPLAQEREMRAIRNLCRPTGATRKNKMLLKLIRASSDKIIVFVKYKDTLDHLEEYLAWEKITPAVFHGQMNNQRKDREIDAFRDQHQVLITTEIGGEGRNLQFCHRMVNYDLPWNPMKLEQRIGRLHRIGQTREVNIYNFCAAGSLEDHILEILDKKINMFEMVIGEIDMIMGRIRGEQDFADRVYDIWMQAASADERQTAFDQLGTRLKRAKSGYLKTRALDDKLFGENYEL